MNDALSDAHMHLHCLGLTLGGGAMTQGCSEPGGGAVWSLLPLHLFPPPPLQRRRGAVWGR